MFHQIGDIVLLHGEGDELFFLEENHSQGCKWSVCYLSGRTFDHDVSDNQIYVPDDLKSRLQSLVERRMAEIDAVVRYLMMRD